MVNGERVWITDQQRFTLDVLGIINTVGTELNKRANADEEITYSHFAAYVAEEVTRLIPPSTHYLRNAVDEADKTRAAMKAEREAWDLARESGFYSVPRVVPTQRSTE